MKPESDQCPCDASRRYQECCGPLHQGVAARDARALMRSRYSAYVRRLGTYLLATWHSSTRPADLEFPEHTRWLGLQIRRFVPIDDRHATVEFVARSASAGGPAQRLHEISRFVFDDGRWHYVDGEFVPR